MSTTSSLSTLSGASTSAIQLNAKASATFDAKLAETQALLRDAATAYGSPALVTQASSLGAEDAVITHLLDSLKLDIPVFVLETGKLHAETLQLLAHTQQHARAQVVVFHPNPEAVSAFVAKEGEEPMYKSIALRKACCQVRKLEPLGRALQGKKAWITGLRREQSGARADVPLVDDSDVLADPSQGRRKYNPLANWTWGDVWHYIGQHQVAYNPLHDQFFPSIGCAPCTRAISLGEDFRAGRWWWEAELEGGAAKECGLHVKHDKEGTAA